jgi:methionyl-tRNA formyltransferase
MPPTARFRIVFFGTPEFAVPTLRALLDGPDEVAGVVCQPDRPAGRGQRLHPPPVKVLAEERGVCVYQPEKLRTGEAEHTLRDWAPDVAVVAAYGRILPAALLTLPRLGCINVHASLLPKYRGAAPIQWAILNGEETTGVTIMNMNEHMDEGDILLQDEVTIGAQETYGELQERLATLGAHTLPRALELLHAGKLEALPQDHSAATLAPLIEKEQGRINWSEPALRIARQVRAFNPWPSAFTTLDGKLLKIHRARPSGEAGQAQPGTVLRGGNEVRVATGAGGLEIDELQLEGRKRLGAADFMRGGGLAAGARLGEGR